jgi:hypothetical protein
VFLCDDVSPCGDERFDAPWSALPSLHHLQPIACFAACLAVRPGWPIAFAEPNMPNPQVFLERHARAWFHYVSPDETAFVRWRRPAIEEAPVWP